MNRFPRQIAKEEYERLTASTEATPSQVSAARMETAQREAEQRVQFQQRIGELLASPQVVSFKQFIGELGAAERAELLRRLTA